MLRLVRYLEEAGVFVYIQITDHLVIPGAVPLVLGVFPNYLLSFETAANQAQQLGVFAPFVGFLDRPEVSFFEAGRFPALIPFVD